MAMINLVDDTDMPGELIMSEADLQVFTDAFTAGLPQPPPPRERRLTRHLP